MFYFLFLLPVALFAFRIVSGKRVDRSITFFITANLVMLSLYIFIDVLSGNGFDESVVYHVIYGLKGAGILAFVPYIVAVLSVIVALLSSAFYLSSNKFNRERETEGPLVRLVMMVGLVACFLANPLVVDLSKQFPVMRAALSHGGQVEKEVARFQNTNLGLLTENEATRDSFVQIGKLVGPVKKNVIWIYAESLERTYLKKDVFGGLLVNLSKHADSARRYTSVYQPWGTGWTIGGIVGSQCGLPLVTLGAKNVNSLANVRDFMPGAFCMGDGLRNSGYTLEFVGGASGEFAGKGNFLRTHGFNTVWDRASLQEKYDEASNERNQWGYYDDFILSVLKNRALELHREESPFFLNGLTLDTHSPHGFVSPSCKPLLRGENIGEILAAIKCSDILLADFIEWFKSSELYDDTILVLSSDHLSMPNTVYHELKRISDERRLLFWVFGKGVQAGAVENPMSTFDLGATVLGHILPGKNVSIGFGRDVEKSESLYNVKFSDNDLRAAVSGIQAFAWREAGSSKSLIVNASEKTFSLGSQSYPFPALVEVRNAEYSGISWIERERKERFVDLIESESSYVWVDVCGWSNNVKLSGSTKSCAHLVSRGAIVESIVLSESRVAKIDVEDVLAVFRESSGRERPLRGTNYAISTSGNGEVGGVLGLDMLRTKRGVNLFEKSKADNRWHYVKNFDLCGDIYFDTPTADVISHSAQYVAVVVDDSAHCGNIEDLQSLAHAIGLETLGSLKFRQPYVAILKQGVAPIEILGKVGASTVVSLHEL